MPDRLDSISKCMEELSRVRDLRPMRPDAYEGLMVAELDWLEELHRLVHDNPVC